MSVVSADASQQWRRPSVYLWLWTYEPDPPRLLAHADGWITAVPGRRPHHLSRSKQLSAISGQQSEIRLIASADVAEAG